MTRPKRVRQAAKNPFAGFPVLKNARVPLSPKYAVEVTLYNAGGPLVLSCIWDPHLPSQAEKDALSDRLDEELAPFYEVALIQSGLLGSGGAL